MLHLLVGTDWTANRDHILQLVSQDVKEKKGNRILLIPELISHETERLLCERAGNTASRFAEVLSFTRLTRRVADELGHALEESLDKGGRVVAMASAVKQLHNMLKAYASVESKPEFLVGLIEAVDEFKRCCISAEDLERAAEKLDGALKEKILELAMIMRAYDTVCQRGKRDPRDQETLLLQQMIEGEFGREHVFYIDGFPDFTQQHMEILKYLIELDAEVTVCVNSDMDHPDQLAFEHTDQTLKRIKNLAKAVGRKPHITLIPPKDRPLKELRSGLFQGPIQSGCCAARLQVLHGQTPYQECVAAAERIMELVRQNHRYREIAVVCTDLSAYGPLINLVFHRCGIPLYMSGTEDILNKSVISTVLSAMEAALGGFEQRSVLRYLRSVLSPVEPDLCDLLENYVIVWGIRGKRWLEEWTRHPDGLKAEFDEEAALRLARINEARRCAMEPLAAMAKDFRGATSVAEQVHALYDFLNRIELQSRLDQLAQEMDRAGDNRSAQILNQLWEILVSALEQLYDMLGDTQWNTEAFSRLFQLLLSQYRVGTIPPVLDSVSCGTVSALQLHEQKHLIVLGAQEGNLPLYGTPVGVLSDKERSDLRRHCAHLTSGSLEGIQAEFHEIHQVFSGATETVTVLYSGAQPSFVTRRLSELAGGEQQIQDQLGAALSDLFEAGAYLAAKQGADAAQALGLENDYSAVMKSCAHTLGRISRPKIDALYGHQLRLSASQIDRQAECRLSYFLKYGLRAKERKEATVDPAEFGTYVHAVLEQTARDISKMGGFPKVSLEQTLEIAKKYSQEYAQEHYSQLDSERLAYLFRRNGQELDFVVRELWEELQQSKFQPEGFEVNFGNGEGLPPIPIQGNTMNGILRGFVDRIDTWKHHGNDYYRVVDYKTGKKDFDYCDVFNGVGLQLLLYLFALSECGADVVGAHPVPAGVQYFPARAPYVAADGRMSPEELEKQRLRELKRKGLLLSDSEVLQAMEPGDNPKRLCYSVKKDGSLSGDLADREQLRQLKTYLKQLLGKMIDEIAAGNIEPNPYTRGSSHSACDFCPYGDICHEAEVAGRRNYKTMTAARFWEEIGKELDSNG